MTKTKDSSPIVRLTSHSYKIKFNTFGGEEVKLYVTIANEKGKPKWIFINTKKADIIEHLIALNVVLAYMFEIGADIRAVANKLKTINSVFTEHMKVGGYSPSMYARIGDVLLEHLDITESKQTEGTDYA